MAVQKEETLESHKIKTPLTATPLDQLQALANDKNRWWAEIARMYLFTFSISLEVNIFVLVLPLEIGW
ncbi:MAG: hypothetical protein GY694_21550 [Gammaproteobacteria bacterium]|nr:hypothetical protein [Gammaproteobacteria bacterium]